MYANVSPSEVWGRDLRTGWLDRSRTQAIVEETAQRKSTADMMRRALLVPLDMLPYFPPPCVTVSLYQCHCNLCVRHCPTHCPNQFTAPMGHGAFVTSAVFAKLYVGNPRPADNPIGLNLRKEKNTSLSPCVTLSLYSVTVITVLGIPGKTTT